MTDKLAEKFIDTLSAHICDNISEKCDQYLEDFGLKTKYISEENKRDLCKVFSDKNFDTLEEECCCEYYSYKTILADCIYKEFECIMDDEDYYCVEYTDYKSLDVYDCFSNKEVTTIKKVLADDENSNFLANDIYYECLSKIGPACELTDIIISEVY